MMNEIILETKADYFLYLNSIFKHTKYIEYVILEGDADAKLNMYQ